MPAWVGRAKVALGAKTRVRHVLDLVAASGSEEGDAKDAVREYYDWQMSRTDAGLQLTFGPVAAGILAIVAKPGSAAVVIVAASVVLVALALGLWQLLIRNFLQVEYVSAVRLARAFHPLQDELARYPGGRSAPRGGTVDRLYRDVGDIALNDYVADPDARAKVLDVLGTPG